jgi:hypothetical protein
MSMSNVMSAACGANIPAIVGQVRPCSSTSAYTISLSGNALRVSEFSIGQIACFPSNTQNCSSTPAEAP